jgi:DNA-binding NarL/FixJ family response regulator
MGPAAEPTNGRVSVAVYASDPLTTMGVTATLDDCAWIDVLTRDRGCEFADVVVLTAESVSEDLLDTLRVLVGRRTSSLVVVLDDPDAVDMMAEHDLNVLSRAGLDAPTLQRAVLRSDRAAAQALLGHLTAVGADLARYRCGAHGLNVRETDVLRLLASGHSVREIADDLNYSERTIKNILYALITRLKLRNRTEAVAYAMRAGHDLTPLGR